MEMHQGPQSTPEGDPPPQHTFLGKTNLDHFGGVFGGRGVSGVEKSCMKTTWETGFPKAASQLELVPLPKDIFKHHLRRDPSKKAGECDLQYGQGASL